MKITLKQNEEIDFICYHFADKYIPSKEEREEYIKVSVLGVDKQSIKDDNKILQAKRTLDITLKMWRQDLTIGLLGADELQEDFKDFPYGLKLIDSVINSVTPNYRSEKLEKHKQFATILSITNFPKIIL